MKTQLQLKKPDPQRAAQEVIDILNRWDARMKGHQTQRRAHERVPISMRICLYHGRRRRDSAEQKEPGITVWARNLSPKGIAFVYKGRIEWKRVLLCLNPDSGETTWMHAEIVRSRHVHNDFWDYGARFLRRATAEDDLPAVEDAVG
ncbi:MAG TPA: PilZ domain-containing protein [Planctomycetaceae bacterium]|nr:PilZ domain-containing protein [Planctomycetaceae bacterium]